MPLAPWIVGWMLVLVPPSLHAVAGESEVEAIVRYHEIAGAMAEAVDLEVDGASRVRWAALVVAVAYYESTFRRAVDVGEVRGDGGRAWCLMQVWRAPQGWPGPDLVRDRVRCFRAGIAMLRRSMRWCYRSPAAEQLAGYTAGRCDRGLRRSRLRMATAARLLREVAP